MRSTRALKQLEERVRNHLKLVSNTNLAIMRPGCLILTATILRSSIKATRRQNIVHQGGETSCWLNTSRSRSSFTPYTEHLKLSRSKAIYIREVQVQSFRIVISTQRISSTAMSSCSVCPEWSAIGVRDIL